MDGSGRLTIDLGALVANYRLLGAAVAPARAAAVVKADAYGLGARKVVPALAAAGCRDFFVAHLSEAADLKPVMPPQASLYVLNGLAKGAEAACLAAGAIPVVNSIEQARAWADAARYEESPPVAVQVDSGMGRLGLSPGETEMLIDELVASRRLRVGLVMSHLACADDAEDDANERQRAAFAALAARFPGAALSLSNSGGALLPRAFHFDLVRLGIALYGASPRQPEAGRIRPVVRLTAPVIQVREIGAGHGVGYGLTCRSDRPRRVATLGVGYADGWPRQLGNRGAAYHGAVRLPIAGRVSMDSMSVDVTALPPGALSAGDEVELIGPHQPLEQVAADADTIPYEILTRLGRRYSRTWVDT